MQDAGFLILVDDSKASWRAVEYVADTLGGQRGLRFYLAHPSPPVPPPLLEFRGAENPDEEERLDEQLKERRDRWTAKAEEAAQLVFARARVRLRKSGVAPSAVETEFVASGSGRETGDDMLKLARVNRCNTVVVGRRSAPWFRRLLNMELAEELVRRGAGFTIWVVE
jgi:nucleotide-binding universal stress UspA family protein